MSRSNYLSSRQIRLMQALVDTEICVHVTRPKDQECVEMRIAKPRPATAPATVYQIYPPVK